MADRIEVELPCPFSDGSSTKWPNAAEYVWAPGDTLYVQKLADLGKDFIEDSKPGEKYVFKELPGGYRIYTKTRKDGKIKDRYIFGHPKAKFDSPIKFFVHFKWMMQGGVGECRCINCQVHTMRDTSQPSMTPISSAPIPSRGSVGAQLENFSIACNKNPDGETKQAWEGAPSWAPHELLDGLTFKGLASRYQALPAFLPRKGELVLFYPSEQPNCRFEDVTQQLKLFDEASGQFLGFPAWRAGVVSKEPVEQLGHEDLFSLPHKHLEETKNFYRIELYPDPDSRDKRLSSQAYLVRLSHIRPLNMFHEFLSGIAQNQWHDTIHYALKVMCTTCVVDPVEFLGKWDSYSIRCRGVWIGPELYVPEDVVRLAPKGGDDSQVDQVLVIERIYKKFENDNKPDERSSIVVAGPVFTINYARSTLPAPLTAVEQNKILPSANAVGYSWYPVDDPDEIRSAASNPKLSPKYWQEIPVSFIVGRLYDSEAMRTLLDIANFDVGGLGVKQAQRWAKEHRANAKVNAKQRWVLTTDRIEALDIETLNGRAVGKGPDQENVLARDGNSLRSGEEIFFGRKHLDGGLSSGGSSNRSASFHGNGAAYEPGFDEGTFDEVMENSGPGDKYDDVRSDNSGHPPRSLQSVATDRMLDWSKDEDENAENFISDVIAGKVLPTAEDEMDGDIVDGDQNEGQNRDGMEHQRPSKRPRL